MNGDTNVKAGASNASQETLNVERIDTQMINIVGADGTRKMAIFDASKNPKAFLEGKEFPGRPSGDESGILFYNAHGDECGGLTFGSRQLPYGGFFQALLLTFDAFRQDQVLALRVADESGRRNVTIDILSRPTGTVWCET